MKLIKSTLNNYDWGRFTLARGGCKPETVENTLENRQITGSAIWTAFGSQAVLWLLYLKTQDVIALEAFDELRHRILKQIALLLLLKPLVYISLLFPAGLFFFFFFFQKTHNKVFFLGNATGKVTRINLVPAVLDWIQWPRKPLVFSKLQQYQLTNMWSILGRAGRGT